MTVMSVRFSAVGVHERLRDTARRQRLGMSTLAERLIDEGLRSEAHPLVVFRGGPAGRRAVLAGGPDLADVIGAIVGGGVPKTKRRLRAAKLLGITEPQVDAALAYYVEFTQEIDEVLAERAEQADAVEAMWRRQQALLDR